MNELFKDNAFNIGFWSGISLFVVFNFLSYVIAHKPNNSGVNLVHGIDEIGFPFTLYIEGGEFPVNQIIWAGLIANFSVAIVFSFVIGLIFKFLWSKILSSYKIK